MLLEILIVSALPISEIRGGIPLAIYYGLDPISAYILAFIGNLIPIPFLLIFLENIVKLMGKIEILAKPYNKLLSRVEKRRKLIEKYGYFGLTLFVAIPLPITGAWTASLLATILNLRKLKSFVFISIGVAIAGFIVLISSLGVLSLSELFRQHL